MRRCTTTLLLLLATAASLVHSQFTDPSQTGKSVWHIGQTQKVSFKLKEPWKEFTIALWQELGGSANIGPMIYQTITGTDTEFDFTVRIEDLKLVNSNKFFLWLKPGDPSQQGNGSVPSMSSSYFVISSGPAPSSTSSSTTLSSTTSPTLVQTSTTNAPANESPTSSSTTSPVVTATSQEGIVISTSAMAGIGAAAGICGLAAIIGAVYCLFKRKWKQRELEFQKQRQLDWPQQYSSPPPQQQFASPPLSTSPPYSNLAASQRQQDIKPSPPRAPVEIYSEYIPMEMDGGHRSYRP